MSRTITMMPVAHILRNVSRSLDVAMYGEFDWFKVFAGKVSHAHFDKLTDAIMDEGFNIPIVLVGNDVDGYCIGNGHHRLSAAILLGLPSIPVIVSEDGDYWAMEDSHDGEWNPGDRSFEYWDMLQGNIPSGYYGDGGNEGHRAQFANRPSANGCGSDDYNGCQCGCQDYNNNECIECGYIECQCGNDCDYCGVANNGDVPYEDHRMGCPEREYEMVYCDECGYSHYRYNACDWMLAGIHDDAIVEHNARGFVQAGAWHPDYILSSAYDENARRERAEMVENARAAWILAVDEVKAAAMRNLGAWAMSGYIEEADARYREFCAL